MFYSVRKYVGYFIVLTIKKCIVRVRVPRTFRTKRLLVKYVLSVKSLVSEPKSSRWLHILVCVSCFSHLSCILSIVETPWYKVKTPQLCNILHCHIIHLPWTRLFSFLFVSKICLVGHTKQLNNIICNFHICTVRVAIIIVFYYRLIHERIVFKGVLKFTLKLQ